MTTLQLSSKEMNLLRNLLKEEINIFTTISPKSKKTKEFKEYKKTVDDLKDKIGFELN